MSKMLIRVIGDPHGEIDLDEDGWWLSQADLRLCTGDFGYRIQGQERAFAREIMKGLKHLEVLTILGNHDGICHHQSLVYQPGEAEPACQEELITSLGDCYLGYRRRDFENFSVVGGRPFSNGNPGIVHQPWGHTDFDIEQSTQCILDLITSAPHQHILILTHNGPKELGENRDDPFARDWKKPHQDWGDEDLALALNRLPENRKIIAVVTGHMHHRLRGGGLRKRVAFFGDIPVINAAVVPRVLKKGLIESRPFEGDIFEKKIFQEHRHFLDLEIDFDLGKLIEARDFWARKGNRQGEGLSFKLL